jgi:hypothetical protein
LKRQENGKSIHKNNIRNIISKTRTKLKYFVDEAEVEIKNYETDSNRRLEIKSKKRLKFFCSSEN